MKTWFASLPVHRKLIALVLTISTASLLTAELGFVAFELARFRTAAAAETHALAEVLAENTAAAIVFGDADAAAQTLASMRVRPVIVQACLYRADGTLLTRYEQNPASTCPAQPSDRRTWSVMGSVVPVTRNGQHIGMVYVERALSDLGGQLLGTLAAGGLMLILAAGIALGLARLLQRTISEPIVELAQAARAIGGEPPYEIPAIATSPDETGELVRAFGDMVRRLGESNIALRAEIDRRRQMQNEREGLLLREREASRLKDEFLAAVSHELRTPLNAILGWTQVLSSAPPSEQTLAKGIASLARNAQAQNRVIEDLLDISRIITGKLQLTPTAVDLRSVIESALDVIDPIATAKNIRVETFLPKSACLVQADHDRLRQIMWNLLSNAVKFTPPGGSVTVRLGERRDGYDIEVTDTGVGIPEAFRSHVFERFRQADGSITREHGGLGLGLAIVKELTELHGGTVRAASEGPGRGSTFTISLPAVARAETRVQVAPADSTDAAPRLTGLSVLAVDDNRDALDIAAATLVAAGATVQTAASGADALSVWLRSPSRILLCDLAMPVMDGFEVLTRIRAMDAAAGRATVALAITAYASEDFRVRCKEAGFQGHIVKPYDTAELVRAVAAALETVS